MDRYLGHMYLAEALVCVDKISDAIEYLNPDKTASISTTFKSNGKTSDGEDLILCALAIPCSISSLILLV